MLSLKDELPLWRNVSRMLDEFHAAQKARMPGETCPFCGKGGVRVETLLAMNGSDEGLRMGFFTCTACNKNWSDRIK